MACDMGQLWAASELTRTVGRKRDDLWLDINVSTSVVEPTQLTATDRCDACGARAYVKVELESGSLLFCGHHANQHLDKLSATAKNIVDERAQLTAESVN